MSDKKRTDIAKDPGDTDIAMWAGDLDRWFEKTAEVPILAAGAQSEHYEDGNQDGEVSGR